MIKNADGLIRVLAVDWEAEVYTECWCRDRASAELIARLLKSSGADVSVRVDQSKKGGQ